METIQNILSANSKPKEYPIMRVDYTSKYTYLDILDMFRELGEAQIPNFSIDKSNKFAYTNICKWLIGDPTMEAISTDGRQRIQGSLNKFIYLSGVTGTGKSVAMELAAKVAKELRLGYYGNKSTLSLWWYNYRSDKMVSYYSQTGDMGILTSDTQTMCIQDFGSEPLEANFMGTRIPVIRQTLEARFDNRTMMTHFTSNIPLSDSSSIIARYGDRAYDRIRGGCNFLMMGGESRR